MKKTKILAKWFFAACLTMIVGGMQAQTSTFTYTATEKIDRFEEIEYFVGATSVQSHTYDAGTQAGTVVYEGTVTEVGNYALQFQSALTSIVIPEGVTTIGYQGFKACSNLTTIKLPKSLKVIGANSGLAFDGCSALANGKFIIDDLAWWCSLDIKGCYSNPVYYAKHIFSDEDTEITNLVIPEGVTTIGHDAFYRCEGITTVSLPSTLETIGDNAFANSGLTSVDFPAGLTTINYGAFMNCANLTSVTIPEGVETIGGSAFSKTGLTSLTLPSTIRNMSQSFYGNESLATLTLTNGITTLEGSFNGCTALTTLNIPGSVKTIGYQDFSGCTGLETITLGEGVEEVTFNNCSNLTSISFPSSIKKISSMKGCSSLETITLKEGIEYIGSFDDCAKLKQINIPSTVTYIGTFRNCNALKKVIVNDMKAWCEARHYDAYWYGPTKMAGKLYSDADTEITNVVIPEGTKEITGEAFIYLPDITSVSIPSTVTKLGNNVFRDCTGLTEMTLPEGVTEFGTNCFYGCTNLTKVHLPSTLKSIGGGAFETVTAVANIYCSANPAELSWSDNSSTNCFMEGKATQFHVFSADDWTTKFPDANVTFVSDATLTISLPLHSGEGSYWATYYNTGQNLQADANTKVYAVALDGESVTLNEVADRIINDGQAVVLNSANSTVTLSLAASGSAGDYTTNSLKGTAEKIDNSYGQPYYVLNNGSEGVGFYKLKKDATIAVRKGYIKLENSTRSFIGIDGTTAIKALRPTEDSSQHVYYGLDGRRTQNPAKGVYVKSGRKIIIK